MPRGSASKKSLFAKEQERPDVARRREQWRKYQGRIDPTRLVFIDETWTKDNMAPLRGWGPRGERVSDTSPHPIASAASTITLKARSQIGPQHSITVSASHRRIA